MISHSVMFKKNHNHVSRGTAVCYAYILLKMSLIQLGHPAVYLDFRCTFLVVNFEFHAMVRFSCVCLINAVWKCIWKMFSWIIKKIMIINQCSKILHFEKFILPHSNALTQNNFYWILFLNEKMMILLYSEEKFQRTWNLVFGIIVKHFHF